MLLSLLSSLVEASESLLFVTLRDLSKQSAAAPFQPSLSCLITLDCSQASRYTFLVTCCDWVVVFGLVLQVTEKRSLSIQFKILGESPPRLNARSSC